MKVEYCLKQPEERSAVGNILIGPVGPKKVAGFTNNVLEAIDFPAFPSNAAESFFIMALCAFMVDKACSRAKQKDSWTRALTLSFPTSTDFSKCIIPAKEALDFLSGDSWKILTQTQTFPVITWRALFTDFQPNVICLFSGGTDSLVGAIDLLEEGQRVLLVSHYETSYTCHTQEEIYAQLANYYGDDKCRRLGFSIRASHSSETSSRARSILFIALALLAASSQGKGLPIYIPENGFIGINPPLTRSRLGSYSTRTTHPFFIDRIRQIFDILGLDHAIINPLFPYSKGRTLQNCQNQKLLREILPISVSCSKTGSARWTGKKPGKNCGCCYPCIMRRAALNSIDLDDGDDYLWDCLKDPQILNRKARGRDLRNVLRAINRSYSGNFRPELECLTPGKMSGLEDISTLKTILLDGMKELTQLAISKACPEVKKYAGISS